MLSLLSASSALVVGPAAGSHALTAISYNRRAAPLTVDSWHDAGIRMSEDDGGEGGKLAGIAGPLTDIWSKFPGVKVQGDTLKTWELKDQDTERVQLSLKSSGRPLDANVELWTTPSYVPTKFKIYTEDGAVRPVNAIIETPKDTNTVAVFNTGTMEFPFDANVGDTGLKKAYESLSSEPSELVQGAGTVRSYTFGAEVESVQVLLKTDERNMKAKIEVTQGPNQVKQSIELYASVGYKNPFFAEIMTPGGVSTIRVINQNTVEFPLNAWVLPLKTASPGPSVVMGGGGF